jgi:hypothetical protein
MQIISLTGVLDDGGRRFPGVPVDPRAPLEIVIGSRAQVQLKVLLPSGAPADITGKTVTLSVKKNPDDAVPYLAVVGTAALARGRACLNFDIAADDWDLFTPGKFLYDLWLTDSASPPDAQTVIAAAPLTVLPR